MSDFPWSADSTQLRQYVSLACLLEATCRKAGNVHPEAEFWDTGYLQFVASGVACAEPLAQARQIGVGAAILEAVRATRTVVDTNTNLGIVLLLAPLCAVEPTESFRAGLSSVLRRLDREDARLAFEAIRCANPGGLGKASDHDVSQTEFPAVTLLEAMQLAAERDDVARQYALGFADVLDFGWEELKRRLEAGEPLEEAVLRLQLAWLAWRPDTLIARKRGRAEAEEVQRRANVVLHSMGRAGVLPSVRSLEGWQAFDAWLRVPQSGRNPGTTADLVTATLFLALGSGIIPFGLRFAWPFDPPGSGSLARDSRRHG